MKRINYIITTKCPAKCVYCYQLFNKEKLVEQTDEEILQNIKVMLDEIPEHEELFFEILGGEPFIKLELMRKIISIIKERTFAYKKIAITTSGLVLDEDELEFIKENKGDISLYISVDGKGFPNSYRTFKNYNSFPFIEKNVKKLIKEDISFGIHTVVHNLNVSHLCSSYEYFEKEWGVKNFSLGIGEYPLTVDELFFESFYEELIKIANKIQKKELTGLYDVFTKNKKVNTKKLFSNNVETYEEEKNEEKNIEQLIIDEFYEKVNQMYKSIVSEK